MEWRISTETEREEVRGGGGSRDTGSTGTDPQYLIVLRREGEHASMWRVGVPAVFGGQAISREKCSCRHLSILFIAYVFSNYSWGFESSVQNSNEFKRFIIVKNERKMTNN